MFRVKSQRSSQIISYIYNLSNLFNRSISYSMELSTLMVLFVLFPEHFQRNTRDSKQDQQHSAILEEVPEGFTPSCGALLDPRHHQRALSHSTGPGSIHISARYAPKTAMYTPSAMRQPVSALWCGACYHRMLCGRK